MLLLITLRDTLARFDEAKCLFSWRRKVTYRTWLRSKRLYFTPLIVRSSRYMSAVKVNLNFLSSLRSSCCYCCFFFPFPHLLFASLHCIMAPSTACPPHVGISTQSILISERALAILLGQWDPGNIWSNILEASSNCSYMQHGGTCHIQHRTCVCVTIPIVTTDCL